MEQSELQSKILEFLNQKNKEGDYVKLNDFLKSLYPLSKNNEPPKWDKQSESKKIRVVLSKMQTEGLVVFKNNQHQFLGTHYYEGVNQVQKHRNLTDTIIEAKN